MTSAQRARLVVALGVLNLVLASLAFAVGIGAPRQTDQGIAAISAVPSPPLTPATTILPRGPTPSASEPPGAGPSQPLTSPEASAQPSAPIEPGSTPVPTGEVIVAERPTQPPAGAGSTPGSTPGATNAAATPRPTAKPKPTDAPPAANPTPKPSEAAHPTPKPTPKPPKATPPPPPPAAKKGHPPCPQAVDGPPGHNKGQPGDQPCGKGKTSGGDKGKGGSGDHGKGGSNDGAIIVLPLALSAALAGGRDRAARSLRRRRSAR